MAIFNTFWIEETHFFILYKAKQGRTLCCPSRSTGYGSTFYRILLNNYEYTPKKESISPNQLKIISQNPNCLFRHTTSDGDKFANLNRISDFARVTVEMGMHSSFPSVYRVVKLALL
uniref:Uncharacterized protein n=1 Tax=Helianthus annuus TaxID=4232 RepID=A0A251THG9_HELAN